MLLRLRSIVSWLRVRERLLPLLISLAVGIGIGVAVSLVYHGNPKEASAVTAAISALRLPPTPLPADARFPGTVSRAGARLALTRADRRYFVAPGIRRDQGDLCLIVSAPQSTATTCFARAALGHTAAFILSGPERNHRPRWNRRGRIRHGINERCLDKNHQQRLRVRSRAHGRSLHHERARRVSLGSPGISEPTSTVTQPTS